MHQLLVRPAVVAKMIHHAGESEVPRLAWHQRIKLRQHNHAIRKRVAVFTHRYSLGVFALLFLLVAGLGTQITGNYLLGRIPTVTPTKIQIPARPIIKGQVMALDPKQVDATMKRLSAQTISLDIAGEATPISPDMVRGWLHAELNKQQGISYITVNGDAIAASLAEIAKPSLRDPVNAVSVTRTDGSSQVIAGGHDGVGLGDTGPVRQQINQQLLNASGLAGLSLPLQPLAYATVGADSINKLLEVNIASKQMWAYEKGQLVRSWPISAGAPATPTPIGQFKVYAKYAVQDMKGFNPDGSKYLQPHVRWINYFLPGGYAVHGNYWRPTEVFGAVNTSHGCVSLPEDQAEWIYGWAPIGTTVITHT